MLFKLLLIFLFIKVFGSLYLLLIKIKNNKIKNIAHDIVLPTVDIIVPMFNEELVIINTITNLIKIEYNKFNIIIIDDGSSDGSLDIVTKSFREHPNIIIAHQENKGKAAALNHAIQISNSDIIVCIDADTIVQKDIIDKILPYFLDKQVAAVSGYIKVGNRTNFITTIQYIEYITHYNFERIIFETLNGIIVVPGALGAFRRSVVNEVGGYCSGLLTEDSDFTFKILCGNYIIKNATDVIGFTEAPATAKMFYRQRVRWKMGLAVVLHKYRNKLFNHTNKSLFFIVLPYTWLFCLILPFIIPILEYVLLYDYLAGEPSFYLFWPYYLIYNIVDLILCISILIKCKEKTSLILATTVQRFFLRHLTFFVYIHIFIRYLNGNLFRWDKITRLGSVKIK